MTVRPGATDDGAVFVVVSGPPASGKSTLAPPLALALGLPLVAKDVIKDALVSVLDVPSVDMSRRVGTAAVAAMFAVARCAPRGAVLESNFHRSRAKAALEGLPGPVVELFCRCDRDVAAARYRRRALERPRAGHFDLERSADEIWNDEVAQPVAGGWPVVYVDTNGPVDVGDLSARVRRLSGGPA